jgi:predicted ester cyclase
VPIGGAIAKATSASKSTIQSQTNIGSFHQSKRLEFGSNVGTTPLLTSVIIMSTTTSSPTSTTTSTTTSTPASTETNKAIVRRFYEEVFNRRKVELIDELIHEPFINNDLTPVSARDRASLKQFIVTLTAAFPNHHHQILDLIAEGDKVVMRCMFTGKHQGIFPGLLEDLPTHRTTCQQQIHILRIQDNQIAEHWVVRDDLAMMVQLGVIPAPGDALT